MMRGMMIDMNDEKLHTLARLQAFFGGTIEVDFAVAAVAHWGVLPLPMTEHAIVV